MNWVSLLAALPDFSFATACSCSARFFNTKHLQSFFIVPTCAKQQGVFWCMCFAICSSESKWIVSAGEANGSCHEAVYLACRPRALDSVLAVPRGSTSATQQCVEHLSQYHTLSLTISITLLTVPHTLTLIQPKDLRMPVALSHTTPAAAIKRTSCRNHLTAEGELQVICLRYFEKNRLHQGPCLLPDRNIGDRDHKEDAAQQSCHSSRLLILL